MRPIVFRPFAHLGPADCLQLVSGHDLPRLRFGLDFRIRVWFDQPPESADRWPGQMARTWQVRLRRLQTETGLQHPHADRVRSPRDPR